MKITTTENVAGRMVEDTLGVVRGSVLWSRRIMKNQYHGLRGLSYATAAEMSEQLQKAKDEAEAKAKAQAAALGGDAIIGMRLEVVELSEGTYQAVAFGTAVKTSPLATAKPFFAAAANDDDAADFFMPIAAQRPELRLVSNLVH